MEDKFKPSNRRGFLKKVATTGAITTGLAASAGTASADKCVGFRVLGRENGTDYTITFPDWASPEAGYDTESGDNVNGNVVSGSVNNGKEDHYYVGAGGNIRAASIDGSAAIQYSSNTCGNYVGAVPDQTRMDVTGNGDYTIGWWNNLTAGNNLESGSIEACYPTYSSTGDPQITCEFDPEGVVTGQVDYPWSDDPVEVDFGTGHVAGYTDSFHGEGGALYMAATGDVTMDVVVTG